MADNRPVNLPPPVTEHDDDATMWAKYEAWQQAAIDHGEHYEARDNCELCRECGPAERWDLDADL